MQQEVPTSIDRFSLRIQSKEDQQKHVCRICFQSDRQLLAMPCHCKGDLGWVHTQCYTQWISRRHTFTSSHQLIKCQICKRDIEIQVSFQRKTKSCRQLREQFGYFRLLTSSVILVILIFLLTIFCMELVGPRQRNGHRIGIFVFLVLLDLVFIIVSIKMIIKVVINKQIKSFKFAGKT